MSFTGKFRHAVDAKGRLIVPSRLREELTEGRVFLTRWLDDCIAMWSVEGWAEIEARLREQPQASPKARAFVRHVAASAHPDEVDKQGRITVPQHLRELAGITRDVVVIGAINRGEIWSPERWEQQEEEGRAGEGRFEALAEGLDF